MIPIRPIQTRYAATSRRTHLARQAALVALVALPGLASCGNNDAEVFRSANSTETLAADTTTADTTTPVDTTTAAETIPAETAPADTIADTTAPVDTTTAAEPIPAETAPADTIAADTTIAVETTVAETIATATFPATGELAVSFSFVPESSSRVRNPYIAVWVEDPDGNLVQTISVWYEQSGKGTRWLSDLPQWYSASGQASDVTMSGATRSAGDYTVAWNGTDLDGNLVSVGDYVLFVEAAREHGPYEITSTPITIGNDGFTVQLPADGELANVSATLSA